MSIQQLPHKFTCKVLVTARHHGCLKILVTCVPIAAMTSAVSAVLVCLCMWRSGPSYIPGLTFPAVSQLGVDLPQKRIYQVGFGICGLLLSFALVMYRELVGPKLLNGIKTNGDSDQSSPRPGLHVRVVGLKGAAKFNGMTGVCKEFLQDTGRWTVELSDGSSNAFWPENVAAQPSDADSKGQLLNNLTWWGHAAAIGVALQGVFTLESQCTPQCFVHWGGAILFMVGAQHHGKSSNELYDGASEQGLPFLKQPGVSAALKLRHFILDYSSMAMFMIPLMMQFGPALSAGQSENATTTTDAEKLPFDAKTMNMMGIMQWGIILQFAIFFCTYTADLRAAV